MKKIHPKTEIKILAKAPISHTHMHVLSLLYQPIIGKEAFGLYTAMHALLDRNHLKTPAYPHDFFYDMLDLNETSFLQARQNLEAVGLIETYQTENGYALDLYLPFSAEAFIKDTPFGVYLKDKIGEERFFDLINHFRIVRPKKRKYKNISVSFDEVFKPVFNRVKSQHRFTEDESKKASFTEKTDIDLVISGLPDSLNTDKLSVKKIKEKLQEIAYIYQCSEADLQKMLLKSFDPKNDDFDLENLIKLAQTHYQKQGHANITKKNDAYSLSYFKNIHPKQLLEEATGSKAAAVELRVIERLIVESGFKHEVINVLIAYVLKELNNDFPAYNYFDKVLATWRRQDIKTAEDAVDHIMKRKRQKNHKPASKRRVKDKPIDTNVDWFDDYLKDQGE